MNKQEVAVFINSLEVGGAEKVISLLLNNFYNEFDIHLILLNKTIGFYLPAEIKIKVIDDSALKTETRILDILKIPFLAYRLKKYLESNNIRLCFSILNRPNYINCFARLLGWKHRILISERAHTSSVYPPNTIAGKTGRFLVRSLYRNADVIVPNSHAIAADLRENFRVHSRYSVVYNPIDLNEHQIKMNEAVDDLVFDQFTFIHVGRFIPQKNHLLLLKAVSLIKEKDFRVLLFGEGRLEKEMMTKAHEMGIYHKILFMGRRENIVKYISACNCLVMSSDFEGFPNVLLEALASNTPVISTDCPTGPREMLTAVFDPYKNCTDVEKGKYGVLVPVNNPKMLSDAMVLLMNDHELRNNYAANGKARAKDFDVQLIMQQYRKIFNEALAGGTTG